MSQINKISESKMLFKIKKIIFFLFIILLNISFLLSQDADVPDAESSETTGSETVVEESNIEESNIKEKSPDKLVVDDEGVEIISNIIVNDFEDADLWVGGMGGDSGLIQVAKRKAAVAEIRADYPNASKFVLGTKILFLKSSFSHASIEAPSPINIPGITKKISVWVYGKGVPHELFAYLSDFTGKTHLFSLGKLDYVGWKKLKVDIPSNPDNPFFKQIYRTKETYFKTHGVVFRGLLIKFDPKYSYGTFYTYFDNLEVESNIYRYQKELEILNIPEDERLDPIDNW